MSKIFISHASEDKPALAEPLAYALKECFEVWYDRFELTAGDSLLQKINEGLNSCDFGVVILSKAFFSKKWTKAELDGLMALESSNRKVILPIWLGVSEVDVKTASPILAGRLGIDGSLPIESIVQEIRRAVEVANRVSTFPAKSPAIAKLRMMAEKHDGLKKAEQLAHSEGGVQIMRQQVDNLRTELKDEVAEMAKAYPKSKFGSEFNKHGSLEIRGPHNLMLVVQFSSEWSNSLDDAVFRYVIALRKPFGEKEIFFIDERLTPAFDHSAQLIWTDASGEGLTTLALKELMLTKFMEQVESAEVEDRARRSAQAYGQGFRR